MVQTKCHRCSEWFCLTQVRPQHIHDKFKNVYRDAVILGDGRHARYVEYDGAKTFCPDWEKETGGRNFCIQCRAAIDNGAPRW